MNLATLPATHVNLWINTTSRLGNTAYAAWMWSGTGTAEKVPVIGWHASAVQMQGACGSACPTSTLQAGMPSAGLLQAALNFTLKTADKALCAAPCPTDVSQQVCPYTLTDSKACVKVTCVHYFVYVGQTYREYQLGKLQSRKCPRLCCCCTRGVSK